MNDNALNNTQDEQQPEFHAMRFRSMTRNLAESVIELGMVVYYAKSKLDDTGYIKFLDLIAMNCDTSTVRKYLQIGKMGDLLIDHVDKLPDSWTTIYKLTQLGEAELKNFLDSGLVTKGLKGNDPLISRPANQLVIKNPASSAAKQSVVSDEGYALRITFPRAPASSELISQLEVRIKAVIDDLQMEYRLIQSEALSALFESPTFAEAA